AKLLTKGNKVEIKSGPLKGKTAIIEKIKNSTYVVVNIPLMNKKIKVEVKKEEIGSISEEI
ncbi:MAG: KOW motif-containing protein, partial [Leptospiraceae bacterium]|nr:KOW motif-containing protein [Leptospiraceae bacterium]